MGLGLSAFFWAPAFLERNSVQIIQLFLPQEFDYHFNFVTLSELFSLPVTADPRLVLPPTPRSVGLIPLALAALALAFGWRRWSGKQKSAAGFATTLALVSLFLTLPQSVAIWDALSLLRFVQFPWRFLSFAGLGLAFLAGGAFVDFSPQRHEGTQGLKSQILGVLVSWWFIGLLVAGMIVYGFTWQYVPYLAPITRPTVADIARYERESGALGTTSAGDYLPNTVKKLPDANTLTERYSRSDVIKRLDPASLPPGAKVIEAGYRPLSSDVTIESQLPFVATFDIFYFAGWQARVDGQPVAITPTDPNGLIGFPVPAGRHRVQVFFDSTPLRTAAGLASLLSVLVLFVFIILRRADLRLGPSQSRHSERSEESLSGEIETLRACPERSRRGAQGDSATRDLRLAISVCVFAIGLLTFKSFYLDTRETIFRRTRFDGTRVAGVAHPLNVNFDNQMALMGYDPVSLATEMGGAVQVTLYWRAMRQLDTDYSISAQLVDARGLVYGQRDSQHPGGYPTSRWTLSDYARDVHDIPLEPGTPPGEYRLRVGVYRVGAPSGLNVLDANGAPSGTTFDVATVAVKRPGPLAWLQKPAMPQPEHSSGVRLSPGLILFGYDLPQAQVDVGAKLFFTLDWQATASQTRELKARLQLVDSNGASVYSTEVAPISLQFPTSRLLAGDVMRGPNSIRIPASTPGGTFALRLALVDESGTLIGETVEMGRVTVRVPERAMTLPRVQYPMQVNLDGQVRLIGYDIKSQNSQTEIVIVLYWQALQEMTSDYKSFVHLLDATGRLVAGSDAAPANWTRPTTGWITGEYVTDPHTLGLPTNLPTGDYQIEAGLYDADSGVRLGSRILFDQPIHITP
jgi:hypothetical protein